MKPHWHHKKISGVPLLGPGRGKFHLGKQEIIPSNWLSLRGKVKVDKSLKFVCFWLGKICFVEVESMKVFKFLPQKNWRWIKVSILKFWVSSFKSVFFPLLKHFYPILMGIFVTIIPWGSRSSYIPRFWGSRTNEKKPTKCQMSLRKTSL